MTREDNAQMMIIESVLFSIMVLMALLFVSQLSPPSKVYASTSSDQLKILGDDALRSIDKRSPGGGLGQIGLYSTSSLTKYIATNDVDSLTAYLDALLPNNVNYNISISNGTKTINWYNGEEAGNVKVGDISVAHCIILINKEAIDGTEYVNKQIIEDYDGYIYEVILEMWY